MNEKKYYKLITGRQLIFQLFLGLIILIFVFMYAVKSDMRATRIMLSTTTNYIKEQCNRYARIDLASETKSLMRIIESDKQVADQINESNGLIGEQELEKYAKNSYVSGIFLLDETGNILNQYHQDKQIPNEIVEAIQSPALIDISHYPEKRYATRIDCQDGSEIDFSAIARKDQTGIVVVYYHTPLEYINSFNLSVESLLLGYDMSNNGTIVVSNGNQIVACNDTSLVGLKTSDLPILEKITSNNSDQLIHTNQQGNSISQYFGLMERGRDFYVYSYIPERNVFTNTPQILLYTIVIYIIIMFILMIMRWQVIQQYRQKEIQAQQAYTKELQNKNDQLSIAVNQADKANAAKSDFLSRMSHDIRTPLNGIIGLLEINQNHPNDLDLIKENQNKMRIAADHLLSLINDVLQMSKLESGEIIISHEPIDLNKLAMQILTIIEQKAAESGITMEYSNDMKNMQYEWIYGSELYLRQIFLNIYTNCIKYNYVGGKIKTVFNCVDNQDNWVTYRWIISDTGKGMSKEFLEHIFDPFTQESADARSVYQGTGLGMTIVKGLIDKMNGTIEIKSEEGKGSTFIITIPFEIAPKPQHKITSTKNVNNLKNLHILLVEDNDLNAEIAKMILEDEGVRVTLVTNGKQAVDQFVNNKPGTYDLILMDVMMPVMDGLTATKIIRDFDRTDAKTIPIIAMTANAFEEDEKKCKEAGMNAYTTKPIRVEKLFNTIQEQIKR